MYELMILFVCGWILWFGYFGLNIKGLCLCCWKFWLLILMLAIVDIDIGVYLELIMYNVYNISGGFLNFQRKLCLNFQVLIMHVIRGSFKVKTESFFNLLIGCFVIIKKGGDCWTLVDFDDTKTLTLSLLIKLIKCFRDNNEYTLDKFHQWTLRTIF